MYCTALQITPAILDNEGAPTHKEATRVEQLHLCHNENQQSRCRLGLKRQKLRCIPEKKTKRSIFLFRTATERISRFLPKRAAQHPDFWTHVRLDSLLLARDLTTPAILAASKRIGRSVFARPVDRYTCNLVLARCATCTALPLVWTYCTPAPSGLSVCATTETCTGAKPTDQHLAIRLM
jgi:hypothetical protein